MRHKMQTDTPGDPFPFREEHWEHALKLLEAEDQRKKRRRAIFWWWLFGVLLLPSAGALAWWLAQRSDAVATTPNREAIALEPAAHAPIAAENTASGANETPENTRERHLPNAEKNTSAATPAQTQTGVEKNIAGANNIPTSINAKSSDHIRKSGATVLSENTKTQKPENTSTAAPENTQTQKHQNTSIALENTKTQKHQNTSLALLAQAETTLRYDRPLTTQSVQVPPAPIKPVREARWSFGVNIEGAAQPLSPGPRYLGFAGGGYARYRISEKWQLGAGIALRQMAINFKKGVAANSSNQLKYSFGYTQETLKDSSLNHYALEIPLGVQRRFGRFGVEAGIAPGMLLGLGATRFTSTKSSLAADPQTTETKVWLGKNAAYKKFWVAPMLALDYRLNKRLALNLNAVYRPGGVLPRNVEFYEQAGTDLSIGLGLRLNLFTIK